MSRDYYFPLRSKTFIIDRKSVKRSRSQLAEDGCPESQLVLAKQLLQERGVVSVNDNDSEENARLGVFWLIKASEQGNVEATNILKECLERGEGITEHNYLDVKSCLSTTQNEKLAKRAAREMFISLSAGQDFITSEQLRRRMSKINLCESPLKIKSKRSENSIGNHCIENEANHRIEEDDSDDYDYSVGWADRGDNFGEKLTEDHLESAASTYSRGELPLVQRVLTLTDPQRREIENLNYLQRTLLHPFLTIHQAYSQLLDKFNSRCRNRSFNLIPGFSHLQILIILILYPLISFETLIIFVPMFVYFFSFLAMVISTLQMLQSKKEYSNFRVWSRLFLSYDRDGNLNTNDAEFEYCKKNLKPFGVFFLSLLINLVVYPFISEFWIPQSEFAIVSFALTFTTLYSFHERSKRMDFLMLFSFGINVLAKYPYETDGVVRQTWRFLDLEMPSLQNYGWPCYASQIVGNGVDFCLNFRGFFYLLIPGIFLKMASRDNWKGTYKVLIPHCVTLSWWQVAVLCCQGATLYGLLRSTLALVGLVFFLPIVSLATLVLPVVAVLKHFADAALTPKTTITTILASIPLILGYFIDKRRGVQLGTYLSKIQIFLAMVSAFFLICQPLNSLFLETNSEAEMQVQPTLTWEQYSTICQRSNWDKRGGAEIQHECVHFSGVNVNWEGTVENVRIVSIQNTLLKILDNLPENVKSWMICLYGEKYEEDCSDLSDEKKLQMCQTVKQINPKNKCHVRSWNKYEFEISLKMKTGRWSGVESTVELRADDTLRNFTFNLKPKDHIWFSGVFNYPETIGSEKLKLSADELGCINCDDKSLTSLKKQKNKITTQYLLKEIYNGFKRILNFIFNPVVIFH